jgi:hypothetical protein
VRDRLALGGELGWRELGPVWLDPAQELELGEQRFDEPGLFTLRIPAELRTRVTLWSAHEDVFGRALELDPAASTLGWLRPGRYLLCAGESTRGLRAEIEIRSGETRRLALALDEHGQLALGQGAPLDLLAESQAAASCLACHAAPGNAAPAGLQDPVGER